MKNYSHAKPQNIHKFVASIAAVILMAGCAGTPPPVEQMALSRDEVVNASSAGSNEYAPIELRLAMEKMATAEQAMKDKNYDLARKMAEQAQVDAKLAGAMSGSAKAKKAADALQEDSRILRQEINRQAK